MNRTGSRTAVLLLASLAAAVLRADQQTAPPRAYSAAEAGTGQIGGLVTSADGSNQPIRRAVVRISAPELRGSREIATDDRGRFLFADLPAGRYQLGAGKPGYVFVAYGQKRQRGTGTPISLASGQKELSLSIALPKGAVVSGRVTDEFGQPISRARMGIAELATVNGQMTLTSANVAYNNTTDGRGEYRIYGLPAGTYVVSVAGAQMATSGARPTTTADIQWAARQAAGPGAAGTYSSAPPAAQVVAFTPVFHPSAIDAASATPIELEAGMERTGIDIAMRFVPVANVAGTVTMSDGAPASGATVILVAESAEAAPGQSMQNSRTTPRGEFTFASIKAGQYKAMVQASSRPPGGRGAAPLDLWGMASVSVDGRDVSGIAVSLQPGMTFGGRIVIDPAATTQAPDLATTRVSLAPAQRAGASFGVAPATINVDGTFVMSGAAPGSYRMTISPPLSANVPGAIPVWTTKSVIVQGRDVIEQPFDIRPGENIDGAVITLTDRITALSGKLVDGQGKPALDYFVVVFSVDAARWVQGLLSGPRSARPASDGAFRFNALPPGEYYIVAATDVDSRALYDAAFLNQLVPAAIKLTIAEGEKKVQDLKIGGTDLFSTDFPRLRPVP